MQAKLSLVLGVAVLTATFAGAFRPSPPSPADGAPVALDHRAPSADPLVAANGAFRAAYRRTKEELLRKASPVILVEGDQVVLLRDGRRMEEKFTPDLYHRLKEVSHLPLGLFVMLTPVADAPLPADRLADLRRFREALVAARAGLDVAGFSAAVRVRQEQIVDGAVSFLDEVLHRGQVSRAELNGFAARQRPMILADTFEAARAQLNGLHRRVTTWRRLLTTEEWKRLRVVVMGGAMPRQGNVAVQYFAHVLGEQGEGRQLIYAESRWDEEKALDLLATHLLDGEIGAAFFNDDRRMMRDLLADDAREYLRTLAVGP